MINKISEKAILSSIDYYADEIKIIYDNDLSEINFQTINNNIITIEKLFKIANKYKINIPEAYINKFEKIKNNNISITIC